MPTLLRLLLICCLAAPAGAQVLWETTLGRANDQQTAWALAPLDAVRCLAVGVQGDTLSGCVDLLLAEVDTSGHPAWTTRVPAPGGGNLYGHVVQRFGERIYVGATHASQGAAVLIFDTTGVLLHHHQLDSTEHVKLTALAVRADGFVYLGGYHAAPFSSAEFWVGGMDTGGALVWQRRFSNAGGSNLSVGCSALALTAGGDVIAAGKVGSRSGTYRLTADGRRVWGQTFQVDAETGGIRALLPLAGDNFLLGGMHDERPWLWKIDQDGMLLFEKPIAGPEPQSTPTRVEALSYAPDGTLEAFTAGRFEAGTFRLDANTLATQAVGTGYYQSYISAVFPERRVVSLPGYGWVGSPLCRTLRPGYPKLPLNFYPYALTAVRTTAAGPRGPSVEERPGGTIVLPDGLLVLGWRSALNTRADIVGYRLNTAGRVVDSFSVALPDDQYAPTGVLLHDRYWILSMRLPTDSMHFELTQLDAAGRLLQNRVVLRTDKSAYGLLGNHIAYSLQRLSDDRLLLHVPGHLLVLSPSGEVLIELTVPHSLPKNTKETVLPRPGGGWILAKLTQNDAVRLIAYDATGSIERTRTIDVTGLVTSLITFVCAAGADGGLLLITQGTREVAPTTHWLSSATLLDRESPWALQDPLQVRHPHFGRGGWTTEATFDPTGQLWLLSPGGTYRRIDAAGFADLEFEDVLFADHPRNIERLVPLANGHYYTIGSAENNDQRDLLVRRYGPEDQPINRLANDPRGALLLYPNPADYQVNVSLVSNAYGPLRLTITDVPGRVVYRETVEKVDVQLLHPIPVDSWPPGTYWVRIEQGAQRYQRAFVVQ